MLNYNIKGTGLDISDELRSYMEKKLAHLEKFLHDETPPHADIELQFAPLRHGEHYRAEVTLSVGGTLYRTERWAESMHAAVDVAMGELQGDLTRDKKKRLHMLRRSATKVKEYLRGWRQKL